jgi:hypothetical protein
MTRNGALLAAVVAIVIAAIAFEYLASGSGRAFRSTIVPRRQTPKKPPL